MSDLLHTHLALGLRPGGECAACDQLASDLANAAAGALVTAGTR